MLNTKKQLLFLIPLLNLIGIIFNSNWRFIIISTLLGVLFLYTNKLLHRKLYIQSQLTISLIYIISSLILSLKIKLTDPLSIFVGNYIWLSSCLLLLILSILIFTNKFTQKRFRKRKEIKEIIETSTNMELSKPKEISVEFINNSINKIKINFNKVQRDIVEESYVLEGEINKLKRQMKDKNKELDILQKKNNSLLIDIEKYEEIKKISIEHARIIKGLIEQRKYLEYIIGFMMGLFVEFIAGILKSLLR